MRKSRKSGSVGGWSRKGAVYPTSRNNNIYTNVLLEVKGYRTPFPLFRGVHWVNILFRAYEGCQLN